MKPRSGNHSFCTAVNNAGAGEYHIRPVFNSRYILKLGLGIFFNGYFTADNLRFVAAKFVAFYYSGVCRNIVSLFKYNNIAGNQ